MDWPRPTRSEANICLLITSMDDTLLRGRCEAIEEADMIAAVEGSEPFQRLLSRGMAVRCRVGKSCGEKVIRMKMTYGVPCLTLSTSAHDRGKETVVPVASISGVCTSEALPTLVEIVVAEHPIVSISFLTQRSADIFSRQLRMLLSGMGITLGPVV